MSFAVNVIRQTDSWQPKGYIDTLYDYPAYLRAGPITLGDVDADAGIAVVGGGLAGLSCAYELARCGYKPTIFEATSRLGGRCYSKPMGGARAIAELGAMRFPETVGTVFHYMDCFGIDHSQEFPSPGKVFTKLAFENEVYDWPTDQAIPPAQFGKIAQDFQRFMGSFVDAVKEGWERAETDWDDGIAYLTWLWQAEIRRYKNKSFYTALAEGIDHWSTQDLNIFGALGVGAGGFAPLYPISFLEMLRLFANRLTYRQRFVPEGIESLTESFWTQKLGAGSDETLADVATLYKSAEVVSIEPEKGGVSLSYRDPASGKAQRVSHDRVVVTCSTRDMQLMGLSGESSASAPSFTARQKDGMRKLHLINSSKLFIRTRNKFWKEDDTIPQNIQTDALPRGVYCLDYPDTREGVVMVSYTWGDGSIKLLSMSPQDRFRVFKDQIKQIDRRFADNLEPVDGEIACIDWQTQPQYMGAFALNYPGQDPYNRALYYQFQTAGTDADTHVYLAGDAVSWAGGWAESAVQTGINAAVAVAHSLGATVRPGSPLTQDPDRFDYDP